MFNYDAAINIYDAALEKLSQSSRIAEITYMKGTTLINKKDYAFATYQLIYYKIEQLML